MEITKEEINDMIWHTLTSDHDGYINGRSEVIERTWTIIEKLQSENTALKRKAEILELEKELLRIRDKIFLNVDKQIEHENNIAELEAKLTTLLKAEQ